MHSRRISREAALNLLYESEAKGLLPSDLVIAELDDDDDAEAPRRGIEVDREEVRAYARVLADGVQTHLDEIDALLTRFADHWTVERMPVVDRIILRLALFELLWCEDVPVAVAINEAVELAKRYSTDASGRFVNGLLGKIAEHEKA